MINAKLTYVVFLSFIACLASSCTSDTPDIVNPDNGSELSFAVAGLSRASVVSDICTPGSKFAVFGDMKFAGNADASPVKVFDKTEITYIDNEWRYNSAQYWYPKHEYSFVAVFPLSAVGSGYTYSDSNLAFTYTVPSSSENEIDKDALQDVIAATHRRYYPEGDARPVLLRFGHLMSLINISLGFNDDMMDSEAYVLIDKVVLSGIKNKADFKIKPAPLSGSQQTDDWMTEVSGQEGENRLTIALSEPKKIMNKGGNVNLFDTDDAIIMLPQAFADDSEAEIMLSYTISGDNTKNQVSIPMKGLRWESDKSYIYKFSLDRSGVIFDSCEINPWNVVPGEEITVD